MQYRDMKSKPLAQLSKKYNISNSRLYQIWRGQEFNRIQWNDLAVAPSMNIIDKITTKTLNDRDYIGIHDLKFKDSYNDTFLNWATYCKNEYAVKRLLNMNADPNIKGYDESTAFVQLF